MNTFDGCCGSCVHMNTNDYVGTKNHCKCTYRGQYYDLTERKCRYYEYDRYKDYYDLNHRWHVISALFKKLELSDDFECIAILEDFRKNFVEKHKEYQGMLEEYDVVGPVLAKCITDDADSKELCKQIIKVFLLPMLDCIKENKNEEAINIFRQLVSLLRSVYGDKVDEYLAMKNATLEKKTK